MLSLVAERTHHITRRADVSDGSVTRTLHIVARDCGHPTHVRNYEISDVCKIKSDGVTHNSDEM